MSVRNPPKAIPEKMQGGLFGDKGRRERHKIEANALSETCSSSNWRGLYNDRMGFFALILEACLMPKLLVLYKELSSISLESAYKFLILMLFTGMVGKDALLRSFATCLWCQICSKIRLAVGNSKRVELLCKNMLPTGVPRCPADGNRAGPPHLDRF